MGCLLFSKTLTGKILRTGKRQLKSIEATDEDQSVNEPSLYWAARECERLCQPHLVVDFYLVEDTVIDDGTADQVGSTGDIYSRDDKGWSKGRRRGRAARGSGMSA